MAEKQEAREAMLGLLTPCGHSRPQADSQLNGVCVFCWRDRSHALKRHLDAALSANSSAAGKAVDACAALVLKTRDAAFLDAKPLVVRIAESIRSARERIVAEATGEKA